MERENLAKDILYALVYKRKYPKHESANRMRIKAQVVADKIITEQEKYYATTK